MALPLASGNVYSGNWIGGSGVTRLGNNYNYGPSEDDEILKSVLASLYYPEMGARSLGVSDASPRTFEWVFDPQDSTDVPTEKLLAQFPGLLSREEKKAKVEREKLASELRTWLTPDEDGGLFWITGKPGSGKSTFMKFLRDHDCTDSALQEWTKGYKLIRADHFFWLPGTPRQQMFEGLLGSLLHAVLSSFTRDLASARTVCGKRWNLQNSHHPWSLRELKKAVQNLGRITSVRAFFLIDGLDECCPQYDHDEFIDTLLEVLTLPNLKSCVSGRPWLEFKQRLDQYPTICLDRLTRLDMLRFVEQRLTKAKPSRMLHADTMVEMDDITVSVVQRANGVFLWAALVVRALTVELKKGLRVERLHQILEDLPTELNDCFEKMIYQRISRTSSGQVSDTASALKLAILLQNDPQLWSSSVWRSSFLPFWLLSCDLIGHPIIFPRADMGRLERTQAALMVSQTDSFLEKTCKDLLVIVEGPDLYTLYSARRDPLAYSVQFLHRTVFDFLKTGSLQKSIDILSPSHFKEQGWVLKTIAVIRAYRLLSHESGCRTILNDLLEALHVECSVKNDPSGAILAAHEASAIVHVSQSCVCFGANHEIADALAWSYRSHYTPRPNKYIRALFRSWPHLAVITKHRIRPRKPAPTLRDLTLEVLCKPCVETMHDCLHHGLIPTGWLHMISSSANESGEHLCICSETGSPILGPRCTDTLGFETSSQISYIDTHVDARQQGIQHQDVREHDSSLSDHVCELCAAPLLHSRSPGLKVAFFALEYAAYRIRSLDLPYGNEHRDISLTLNASFRSDVLDSLPFDLPASLQPDANVLAQAYATSHFQSFVWRRQKIRSVRSLLTTIRKQLTILAGTPPQVYPNSWVDRQLSVIGRWVKFLKGFVPALHQWLDWYCGAPKGNRSGSVNHTLCDDCKDPIGPTVAVCLDCIRNSLICETCCNDTASLHGLRSEHFCFEIRAKVGKSRYHSGDSWHFDIADVVRRLITWYLSNAATYGLEVTIPSDVADIQHQLNEMPDVR